MKRHSELTEIYIPKTVTNIDYHSFYEDENLKSIHVAKGNWYFSDIDGILYDKQHTTLLCCPNGLEKTHIPEKVTKIHERNAFAGCINLKEITVDKNNKNFTVIDGILYEHNGLKLTKLVRCPVNKTFVQIPESITEIYPHAFEGCAELEEIFIPDAIKRLEHYAFKKCTKLKTVHFPKNLNSIGDSCFQICQELEEVILPNGTQNICANAFDGCRH